MPRAVSVGGVCASAPGAAYRTLLGAAFIAVAMAPQAAVTQQNRGTDGNTVPLPEIRIIATTEVPPPRSAARPRDAAAVGHRGRPLQLRSDQSAGRARQQAAAQRQSRL